MNTKASELREDIRGELIEMLETIRNSGITRLSKRHKEHIDLCTEELYHIFITYTADAVKEADLKGSLEAAQQIWAIYSTKRMGEPMFDFNTWLPIQIAEWKRELAELTNQEQQGGK